MFGPVLVKNMQILSYDRFYSQFSSVLGHFFWPLVHKKLKDAQCSDRSFSTHEFFLVQFFVFELLLILYFTVVTSDLGRLVRKQRSVAL